MRPHPPVLNESRAHHRSEIAVDLASSRATASIRNSATWSRNLYAWPTTARAQRSVRTVAMSIDVILPRVSANTLSGLLETLAGEPYRGKADLPVIADESHLEVDALPDR